MNDFMNNREAEPQTEFPPAGVPEQPVQKMSMEDVIAAVESTTESLNGVHELLARIKEGYSTVGTLEDVSLPKGLAKRAVEAHYQSPVPTETESQTSFEPSMDNPWSSLNDGTTVSAESVGREETQSALTENDVKPDPEAVPTDQEPEQSREPIDFEKLKRLKQQTVALAQELTTFSKQLDEELDRAS